MPMRKVRCQCGTRVHVDDGSIGQRIQCRCGRTIVVRRRPRSFASRARLVVRRLVARAAARLTTRSRRRRRRERPAMRVLALLCWGYLVGALAK